MKKAEGWPVLHEDGEMVPVLVEQLELEVIRHTIGEALLATAERDKEMSGSVITALSGSVHRGGRTGLATGSKPPMMMPPLHSRK